MEEQHKRKLSPAERKACEREWYANSRSYTTAGVSVTMLLVILFYPMDSFVLNEKGAEFLQFSRLAFMLPMLAFQLWLLRRPAPDTYYRTAVLAYAAGGTAFCAAGMLSPEGSAFYIFIALIQTIVILLIALRIPFRYCAPVALYLFVMAVAVTEVNQYSGVTLYCFITGLAAVTLILVTSVYVRDREAQQLFLTQQETLAIKEERHKWLAHFSRFLNHELSNQLVGISTSLERLQQQRINMDDAPLRTARKSVKRCRDLLKRTAEAASLEEAITLKNKKPIPIHTLLEETLFLFEATYPDLELCLKTHEDFVVNGDETLIIRALANLLDNAARHHRPGTAITIATAADGEVCIENIGDPLPNANIDPYQLGSQSDSGNDGQFGLGLYLVKTVMHFHEGEVVAEALEGSQGVRFRLRFPVHTRQPVAKVDRTA